MNQPEDPPSSALIEIDILVDAGCTLPDDRQPDDLSDYLSDILNSGHVQFMAGATGELAVRLCNDAAIQQLNRDYRQKDTPTNVLSFPGIAPDDLADAIALSRSGPPLMLGDIILSLDTCTREAAAAQKPLWDHMRHLLLHGLLHLLGYDHIEDAEAEAMESLEIAVLAQHSVGNPYV